MSVLILGAIIWCLQMIYDYHYSSYEWQRWLQLNSIKSEFIDYERITYNENTAKIFAESGFTENDFYIIKSFQYIDKKYYEPDKLKHIVTAIRSLGLEEKFHSYNRPVMFTFY